VIPGQGGMYEQGRGVPQDYAEAVRWYRKAADQGWTRAQVNLGVMYEQGQGVPQDYALAHMWYNLAAAQGNKDAAKWRDELAAKMTPAQIAEAQRLARGSLSPTQPLPPPPTPLADPQPPPHPVADAVTLYPDLNGRALHALHRHRAVAAARAHRHWRDQPHSHRTPCPKAASARFRPRGAGRNGQARRWL
jgi:TPR repeat protein